MADTILKLAEGACPTIAADIYTAAAKISVLAIDISNSTGSTQDITVKVKGYILFNVSMPTKGGVSWHGPQVLEIGDAINMVCDSATCEYNITGVEVI